MKEKSSSPTEIMDAIVRGKEYGRAGKVEENTKGKGLSSQSSH